MGRSTLGASFVENGRVGGAMNTPGRTPAGSSSDRFLSFPATTVLTAVLSVALAVGCGAEGTATSETSAPTAPVTADPGGPSGNASPTQPGAGAATPSLRNPTPGAPVAADLTIAVSDGRTSTTTYTLTCEPTGGTHPQPASACDQLANADLSVFDPVPQGSACTDIFGGPQTATVTGTVAGKPVDASFNRSGGCEIERWNAVQVLLGPISSDI